MIKDALIANLRETIDAFQRLVDKQEEIIKKQQIVMEHQAQMIISLKRDIQSFYDFPISIQ